MPVPTSLMPLFPLSTAHHIFGAQRLCTRELTFAFFSALLHGGQTNCQHHLTVRPREPGGGETSEILARTSRAPCVEGRGPKTNCGHEDPAVHEAVERMQPWPGCSVGRCRRYRTQVLDVPRCAWVMYSLGDAGIGNMFNFSEAF